ncbi:hypothetical protein F4819DRAFT_446219 [Hypoxylon fuscum]|nr:hypothetical protein F4819DRAFT_446219 [Hypoxylon fuscum]
MQGYLCGLGSLLRSLAVIIFGLMTAPLESSPLLGIEVPQLGRLSPKNPWYMYLRTNSDLYLGRKEPSRKSQVYCAALE